MGSSARKRDKPQTDINYETMQAGKHDPRMNQPIKKVVEMRLHKWAVFLNDDLETLWLYGKIVPSGLSEVAAEVAELEAIPVDSLSLRNRMAFRLLLAQAAGRVFMGTPAAAQQTLDHARKFVRARLAEQSRTWYLIASLVAAALLAALHLIFVHPDLLGIGPGAQAFLRPMVEAGRHATTGGLGACFWMILRMGKFPVDPSAGKLLHTLEALARIAGGVVGGYLVYKASVSGLLSAETQHNQSTMFLLAFAAGATERFVPNLVGRVNQVQEKPSRRPGRAPGDDPGSS